MLMDLYDGNPLHPIQYHFDKRFKGCLPLPDVNLCSTALENVESSRTKDNYPTDEGLLKTQDGKFFNASTIEGKDRTYIATQHPLPSTVADFWKMVLAEKPAAVVMLNKYEYDQAAKNPNEPELVQYWPGTSKSGFIDTILLEDPTTGGALKISVLPEPPVSSDLDFEELETVNSPKSGVKRRPSQDVRPQPTTLKLDASPRENFQATESVHTAAPDTPTTTIITKDTNSATVNTPTEKDVGETSPKMAVNTDKSDYNGYKEYHMGPHIEYSKLVVEDEKGESHQLWHIRCSGWKDQDAPDLDMFVDLWKLVQEKLHSYKPNDEEKVKLVIHCTGGVGRTGTFIAIDIAGQELKDKQNNAKWEDFSIEKVIAFLRKKRMNMVGSASQYVFCHRAALNLFGSPPLP